MMWGYDTMMGSGLGLFAFIFWIVLFIDSILLGIWLWRQLERRK